MPAIAIVEGGEHPNASLAMTTSGRELPRKAARSMFPSMSTGGKRKRLSVFPVIRVIQIDTPKLVQTDAADFRSTVQNLTGNTSNEIASTHKNNSSAAEIVQCPRKELKTSDRGPEGDHSSKAHLENMEIGWPDLCTICSIAEEEEPSAPNREYADSFDRCCSAGWPSFSDRDIIAGLMIDSGEPLPDVGMLPPLVDETRSGVSSIEGSSAAMNVGGMKDAWNQSVITEPFQFSLP